jgi:hypothetical protein
MPWPMFERVERQEVTLHDMMERLGVDPTRLARLDSGEVYARVRSICLFCPASTACHQWLGSGGNEPASPNFCPNLATLLACRRIESV